jgi:glyoxylase I family protein|tara:strand:+ start:224 stop:634 length:411 start_codon:yes stop_codon:yes gene_type:complete
MALPDCELRGIDHVVIRVHQLAPMLNFYRDILGACLKKENADMGLYHLSIGSSMIDLVPVDGKLGLQGGAPPGREGHNVDHIAIKIFPFDGEKIRKYLISQGVNSEEPVIRYGANGKGPSIYIKDPEGNGIELKGV